MKRIIAILCVIVVCFSVLASVYQQDIVTVSFGQLRTATNTIESHQVDVTTDLQYIGALSRAYRECIYTQLEYTLALWYHNSVAPVTINTIHIRSYLPSDGNYTVYFDAGENNDTHFARYIYVVTETKEIDTGNFFENLIAPVTGTWGYIAQITMTLGIAAYGVFMTAVDEILTLVSIVTGYGSLLFGDISILPN